LRISSPSNAVIRTDEREFGQPAQGVLGHGNKDFDQAFCLGFGEIKMVFGPKDLPDETLDYLNTLPKIISQSCAFVKEIRKRFDSPP